METFSSEPRESVWLNGGTEAFPQRVALSWGDVRDKRNLETQQFAGVSQLPKVISL